MSTKSEKAMSGRWLLTIAAGVALLIFVVADCVLACRGGVPVIDPMALLSVISIVVAFYFAKPPDGETNGKPPQP